MSKARTWVLGAIAAMLVVVIGGWMLGISPILTQITAANAQTTTIQASNAKTQSQLVTLKAQFAGISTLQASLDTLRLSVPEVAAASAFIHEVTALSGNAGTAVQAVAISNATLYTAAAPDPTAVAPTPTPAPTTPTTGVATTPTVTSNGLVIIPVVVTVSGSLAQDQAFAQALQTGVRLFVSSSLTVTTDAGTGKVTATIAGSIFSLQGSSDTSSTDPTTPTDPTTSTPYPTLTPTQTPTPTNTSSSSGTTSGSGTGTTTGTTTGKSSGGGKKPSTPKPPSTPNPINPGG